MVRALRSPQTTRPMGTIMTLLQRSYLLALAVERLTIVPIPIVSW